MKFLSSAVISIVSVDHEKRFQANGLMASNVTDSTLINT